MENMKEDLIEKMSEAIELQKNRLSEYIGKDKLNHFEVIELARYKAYIDTFENVINYIESKY